MKQETIQVGRFQNDTFATSLSSHVRTDCADVQQTRGRWGGPTSRAKQAVDWTPNLYGAASSRKAGSATSTLMHFKSRARREDSFEDGADTASTLTDWSVETGSESSRSPRCTKNSDVSETDEEASGASQATGLQKPDDADDGSTHTLSAAYLMNVRAALLSRFGVDWGAPGKGGLKSSPCSAATLVRASPSVAVPESPSSTPAASPTAWRPPSRRAADQDEDVRVGKAVRAIFNKLTVEKFDALYEQLATCGIRKPQHVTFLMQELFQKATVQHQFIAMYADLSVRLKSDLRIAAAFESDEEGKNKSSFKRLLLNECQSSFERLFEQPPTPPAAPTSEEEVEALEEVRILAKRKKLGTTKLIAQLLVRGIVHSELLCECAAQLLAASQTSPDTLELLSAFLTVVGPTFDTSIWTHWNRLDSLFKQLSELSAGSKLSSRDRFLLKDVLDLRSAGWRQHQSGPMRLEEVRRAATPKSSDSKRPSKSEASWRNQRPRASTSFTSSCGSACSSTPSTPSHGSSGPKGGSPAVSDNRLLRLMAVAKGHEPTFDVAAFHQSVTSMLRELKADKDVTAAIQKLRATSVPARHQAKEFADLIARICEEASSVTRRAAFNVLAGLCRGKDASWDHKRCCEGAASFFRQEYEDLSQEVPRLGQILKVELVPVLEQAKMDVSAFLPLALQDSRCCS
eukprot:TRINITY_DN17072_c0_g1_i1.p1 TRINITY_DN17072_c0_g1~~TRINITY_DN17072_c0_g1_i1.p1  ORF type:complete len:686 (-),score=134.22 TRINITY_DN17072_c0_g1_i1:21-2078(-)